ncbi:pyridoxamine 5'-phosphate oxidase family protein [Roseomonas sp. F4]
MRHRYLEIATTPSVLEARDRYGGSAKSLRAEPAASPDEHISHLRLGAAEQAFVAACDGFYLASVSETGWPYVQFRGGPIGFLRVLDERTLGFADFRGNRQYLTVGNVTANDRVSLFVMDYPRRQRLKIFGRMQVIDAQADPALIERLAVPDYAARIERTVLIAVDAFDWNCPQHITPRFTEAELASILAPIRDELAALRAENARLRREIGL